MHRPWVVETKSLRQTHPIKNASYGTPQLMFDCRSTRCGYSTYSNGASLRRTKRVPTVLILASVGILVFLVWALSTY